MDNGIISVLQIVAIFLPLIYGIYLLSARLKLSFVEKRVLNWGNCFVNLFSFLIFAGTYFFSDKKEVLKQGFDFFVSEKFNLSFGILIDDFNLKFLIFASFVLVLLSIYSKLYFDKKKQFIFTKQRFYSYISLLSFLIYIFISSVNLFQSIVVLFFQTMIVFVFSYFDIFKNPTNYNITRFNRISLIGNFSFLLAGLILLKYAILSQGYVVSTSLDFDEFNVLVSYMYGMSSEFEFILMTVCFLILIFTRLSIFPFSCYYSFFSNSSNLGYLIVLPVVNNLVGIFIFLKIIAQLELLNNSNIVFAIVLGVCSLISLIQILFERNIKIIIGYFVSIINSIFMIAFLFIQAQEIIIYSYFLFLLFLILTLMVLFSFDKVNLKHGLIEKQTGFLLEKTHILVFEKIMQKISQIITFVDETFVQNITSTIVRLIGGLVSAFAVKFSKSNGVKSIRNILIIFALFALLGIFVALFGGFKC